MNLHNLNAELEVAGFNLFSVLGRDEIRAIRGLEWHGSLILVGNAGPDMWRNIPREYFDRQHPVDDFARDTVHRLMTRYAGDESWKLLFPGEDSPSLISLGKIAGWHFDSPLGSGINSNAGLWFAYRAVVALAADLPSTSYAAGDSPCLSCESRACVQNCPSEAVSFDRSPDLQRCLTHRTQPDSSCAKTCVARLSCPVAPQFRYDDSQLHYHYRRALPALLQWLQSSTTDSQQND